MQTQYTLDDLAAEAPVIGGKPARLAVIGNPISHSKSPQMQQAALDYARIEASYIRVLAEHGNFPSVVARLQELGFIGCNVTVPYKTEAYALSTPGDPLAMTTQAVNTLAFNTDGTITGFNTDGMGFARAIRECFSVDLRDLKIVLLGACGGAGTALAHTCALQHCERLTLVNRPRPELARLRDALALSFVDEERLAGSAERLTAFGCDNPALRDYISEADLIVNATALGLKPTDPSPISSSLISAHHLVYDLQTHDDAFQMQARDLGARVENGLSMLLHQGALAFERWFGKTPSIAAMRRALDKA